MGLMYIFPVSTDDDERTEVLIDKNDQSKTLVLKTYGLPMLFWGYLAAALIVLASMWMASESIIKKLLGYEDPTLVALGYLVLYTLSLTPIVLVGFFFYEKHMKKKSDKLTLIYKVFFIPFFSRTIKLDSNDALSVNHFMDSPNVAKIHNSAELKQFENKGYFELQAISGGKKILIDRHSRKADLIKIKELMSQY